MTYFVEKVLFYNIGNMIKKSFICNMISFTDQGGKTVIYVSIGFINFQSEPDYCSYSMSANNLKNTEDFL